MKILQTFGIGAVPSQSTATFSAPSQQQTILIATNPRHPVLLIVSNQGVRISRGTVSAGIQISDLMAAMETLEPTLAPPPLITVNPASTTVQYSAPASFSVTATSDLSVTYQWQVLVSQVWTNLVNNATYSNVTTSALGVSNSSGLNGNQYRCVVTNASGSANSAPASLNVIDPGILTQPASHSIAHPNPTSFTVVAAGATTLSYQWQVSTDGGLTWGNLADAGVYSGSATATLSISNSTTLNGYQYRCVVTDTAGTTISNAATLTVT